MGFLVSGKHKCRQMGLAITEFAMVLPVVLLMLTVVAEMRWAFHTYVKVSKSVDASAGFLASAANGNVIDNDLIAVARNLAVFGDPAGVGTAIVDGFGLDDVSIVCSNGATAVNTGFVCGLNGDGVAPVTVTATYSYAPILGDLFSRISGSEVDMSLDASSVKVLQ